MKGTRPRKLLYTEEDMKRAVKAIVKEKKSQREAARRHGVPLSTLRDRLVGTRAFNEIERTVIAKADEDKLVAWILECARQGFRMTMGQVQRTIQSILNDRGAKTIFTNNKPGRKWVNLFLKRHAAADLPALSSTLTDVPSHIPPPSDGSPQPVPPPTTDLSTCAPATPTDLPLNDGEAKPASAEKKLGKKWADLFLKRHTSTDLPALTSSTTDLSSLAPPPSDGSYPLAPPPPPDLFALTPASSTDLPLNDMEDKVFGDRKPGKAWMDLYLRRHASANLPASTCSTQTDLSSLVPPPADGLSPLAPPPPPNLSTRASAPLTDLLPPSLLQSTSAMIDHQRPSDMLPLSDTQALDRLIELAAHAGPDKLWRLRTCYALQLQTPSDDPDEVLFYSLYNRLLRVCTPRCTHDMEQDRKKRKAKEENELRKRKREETKKRAVEENKRRKVEQAKKRRKMKEMKLQTEKEAMALVKIETSVRTSSSVARKVDNDRCCICVGINDAKYLDWMRCACDKWFHVGCVMEEDESVRGKSLIELSNMTYVCLGCKA